MNPGGIGSESWLLPRLLHCPAEPPGGASARASQPARFGRERSVPVPCASLSSVSGLHSSRVSSKHAPSSPADNPDCLQTLPGIPWREKFPGAIIRAETLAPAPSHPFTESAHCVPEPGLGWRLPAETTARRSWTPGHGEADIQDSGTPGVKFIHPVGKRSPGFDPGVAIY